MSEITITMPRMGESVVEATVLKWLKKEGEQVSVESALVEIATDKVDSEVPASHEGILKKILVATGQVVRVGAPLAIIETGEASSDQVIPTAAVAEERQKQAVSFDHVPPARHGISIPKRKLSPLVRQMADVQNISHEILVQIRPTGQDHQLTKRDLVDYLQQKRHQPVELPRTGSRVLIGARDRVVPITRMQRIAAEKMVQSKHMAPHVTSFLEADVTDMVAWRAAHRSRLERAGVVKLTYTPLLIHAVAQTLRSTPALNAWIDHDQVVQKHEVNIGVATALSEGDLIVPVIKRADTLTVAALASEIHTLTMRARTGMLKPEDAAGATYTVSNIGTFGNTMGTPIITQPQVGVLAMGKIEKKPIVCSTPQGDSIAVRMVMSLSHTYDHRVVNGAVGGGFLQDLARRLASFALWARSL